MTVQSPLSVAGALVASGGVVGGPNSQFVGTILLTSNQPISLTNPWGGDLEYSKSIDLIAEIQLLRNALHIAHKRIDLLEGK